MNEMIINMLIDLMIEIVTDGIEMVELMVAVNAVVKLSMRALPL